MQTKLVGLGTNYQLNYRLKTSKFTDMIVALTPLEVLDCRNFSSSLCINAKFYVEVLKRPRKRVRCTRSELWAENAWILHQDNAPSHTAFITREFLAKISLP